MLADWFDQYLNKPGAAKRASWRELGRVAPERSGCDRRTPLESRSLPRVSLWSASEQAIEHASVTSSWPCLVDDEGSPAGGDPGDAVAEREDCAQLLVVCQQPEVGVTQDSQRATSPSRI